MEKTIEQINQEMADLMAQRQQVEDAKLNETIYGMFAQMTKEEVLAKIGEMMNESLMLKMEVKRLLLTPPVEQVVE